MAASEWMQALVHIDVDELRAVLDLVAGDFQSAVEISATISLRKRAEPVMFVRSPILTKFISGLSVNASSPESRNRLGFSGTLRGGSPAVTSAKARICAGVVPQQPPTILTSPSRANSSM